MLDKSTLTKWSSAMKISSDKMEKMLSLIKVKNIFASHKRKKVQLHNGKIWQSP